MVHSWSYGGPERVRLLTQIPLDKFVFNTEAHPLPIFDAPWAGGAGITVVGGDGAAAGGGAGSAKTP